MKLFRKKKLTENCVNFNEPHKIFYPIGASYCQYDNRTPNELFSDTTWEYRGKVQGIPWWVRVK